MEYKKEYDEEYWLDAIYNENKDLTREDRELIKKAYFFAEIAHKNQKRKSGEPYFIHLVATAKILADLKMDGMVIAAGILHDSIEDGVATKKKIKEYFGEEILFLINGVTKLGTIRYQGMERHNESLRKLFVATSEDIRVLIIKFADRVHNLRTLEFVRKDKQLRIAVESLEIYTQLAFRLGISSLSKKLGDLSFPYVYPEEYDNIKNILKERSVENLKNLEQVSRSISKKLISGGIKFFKISHRIKAILSLYKKLKRKNGDAGKVYDLIALRLVVQNIADCYKALGIIHENFRPMPGRIKDYIAFTKPNGYQSLHTTIFTGQGGVLEIQIRTDRMHIEAEYGAASHIGYKNVTDDSKISNEDWVSRFFKIIKSPFFGNNDIKVSQKHDKIGWVDDLAEHTKKDDSKDVSFEKKLKEDFFEDRIFVFTPDGDVIDLPVESTPVDFAYQLHTKLGNTISGAKINENFKALNTELKNGDIVEIISNKNESPNIKWLEFVKTNTAKRRIKNEYDKIIKKTK